MAQTPLSPVQVQELLDNETHNLQQLQEILLSERDALTHRDSERLQQQLSHKTLVLEALSNNAQTRQHLLQQAGYKNDPANWRSALAQLDRQHSQQFAIIWQQIETKLRQCQLENDINAKIVARTQYSVGQILDALRGRLGQPKLYNQKGYAGASGANQSLRTISHA